MPDRRVEQGILRKLEQATYLPLWVDAFLLDRRASGLRPGSLRFYRNKLTAWLTWCQAQAITSIDQVTATELRQYLLYLQETGHSPGGIHAYYRAIKALLRFYELEAEPDNWRNPIRKVKAPRVPVEPLEPVAQETMSAMIGVCKRHTFHGDRDRAIILALFDTGARALEFLGIDLDDVNLVTGEILIRQGKGGKTQDRLPGQEITQGAAGLPETAHRQPSGIMGVR